MLIILAVFIVSFVQSFLATREIHSIAHSRSVTASMWAGIRATVSYIVLMVVIKMDSWGLGVPYVLGDVVATYIALRKFDRDKKKLDNQ